MNPTEQDKIKRFITDPTMSSAVKKVIADTFMTEQSDEVHFLAAQTLAYRLLLKAWRELERYKPDDTEKKSSEAVA